MDHHLDWRTSSLTRASNLKRADESIAALLSKFDMLHLQKSEERPIQAEQWSWIIKGNFIETSARIWETEIITKEVAKEKETASISLYEAIASGIFQHDWYLAGCQGTVIHSMRQVLG